MQTRKKTRPHQVQTPNVKSPYASKYKKEDTRVLLIILAALCIALPPLGVLLTWRARKVELKLRGIFSSAALLSSTLIFFLLMRPDASLTDIRPTPATPQTVGYGSVSQSNAVLAQVPAQPVQTASTEPVSTEEPVVQQGGELTDDTIVYAVTNNASSYHLYELCDQQENHRALTLRDALSEGLAPCEKCVGAMG